MRATRSWILTIIRKMRRYRTQWAWQKCSKNIFTFAVYYICTGASNEKLGILQNAVYRTFAMMVVQLLKKAWDGLVTSSSLGALRVVIELNKYVEYRMKKVQKLSRQSDGLLSLKRQETIFKSRLPLLGRGEVGATASKRLSERNELSLLL